MGELDSKTNVESTRKTPSIWSLHMRAQEITHRRKETRKEGQMEGEWERIGGDRRGVKGEETDSEAKVSHTPQLTTKEIDFQGLLNL